MEFDAHTVQFLQDVKGDCFVSNLSQKQKRPLAYTLLKEEANKIWQGFWTTSRAVTGTCVNNQSKDR